MRHGDWSEAFLTGTVADIRSMEGASCLSTPTVPSQVATAYLRAQRREMEHYLGVPITSITIERIQVRDVTATTGEAEVHYSLPVAVVGNDNWVAYGSPGRAMEGDQPSGSHWWPVLFVFVVRIDSVKRRGVG